MTTSHVRGDTQRHDVVDVLHGVEVHDPYRWLEDGDDSAVQRWVAQQNACTRAALDAVPSRSAWHARLIDFMNLPVVQAVRVRGDRLFLLERGAGEQQASLVRAIVVGSGWATVTPDRPGRRCTRRSGRHRLVLPVDRR